MTKHLILDSQVRHASEMHDVDAACQFIQNLLGVTDGGIAGQVFSGVDWDGLDISGRMDKMREYIRIETAN